MDENKKALSFIILLLIVLMFLLILAQWIVANEINMAIPIKPFYERIRHDWIMRVIYCVLIPLTIYFTPGKAQKKKEKNLNVWIVMMFVLGIIFVLGFSKIGIYNFLIFPLIFLSYTLVAIYVMLHLRKTQLIDDDSIFGCSQIETDFCFSFPTEKGNLIMNNPRQNFWVDSSAGGGKSETWIKPIIVQCVQKNIAAFIYDWEGDPTSGGESPILTRVAYGSLMQYQKQTNLKFAFINFKDMLRSSRVNILSEKYIDPKNPGIFIRNIAITLMKNLEPSWKEKTDFWANNAINYVYAIAFKCYKEREKGINTLAHVIAIAMEDIEKVFEWLRDDDEIRLVMASMLSSYDLGASQQTAGVISSAQTPLTILLNKNIFWVFSPKPHEELSLDITNKNEPTMLCVGNSPDVRDAISPAISCIAMVAMSQMNRGGKQRSIFLVDEFPTIVLYGIERFISTARKHHVATILALQDFNQAISNYGREFSKTLKTNCGNQAYGSTGNYETAEGMEKLLGEENVVKESISEQDTGGGSRSESFQKEKVIKARDIAGQPAGHFVGKIANGKPPYFNLQFDLVDVPTMDIPPFAKLVNTGDKITDDNIMDSIVQNNYEKILQEVRLFLNKKADVL